VESAFVNRKAGEVPKEGENLTLHFQTNPTSENSRKDTEHEELLYDCSGGECEESNMVNWARISTNQGLMNARRDSTWMKAEAVEILSEETTPPALCG